MAPPYSQPVFFRVGWNKWLAFTPRFPSWATLEVADDALALSWWNQKWSIPKSGIRALVRLDGFHGLLPPGMRIEHSVPRLDRYITIRTFQFEHLKSELESRGYVLVNSAI